MKLVFFLCLFILNLVFTDAFANKCGEISQITGKVDVLRVKADLDSERVAIHVATPFEVLCTDVIVTRSGSRAKVKLDNGLITMSPNSRMAISSVLKEKESSNIINLTFGKIRTFFTSKEKDEGQKKDRQTRLRVKTPSAVVGVRGTDFFVSFDPNKDLTTQATLKGEVLVEQVGTGQTAIVTGGNQVEVLTVSKSDLDLIKENESNKTVAPSKTEAVVQAPTSQTQKELPSVQEVIKPLEVVPIEKGTVVAIRQTSPLVKKEDVFNSQEAVKILGSPEKWTPAADEIPGDLKDIKNVF